MNPFKVDKRKHKKKHEKHEKHEKKEKTQQTLASVAANVATVQRIPSVFDSRIRIEKPSKVIHAIIELSSGRKKANKLHIPLQLCMDTFLRHYLQLPPLHILRHQYIVSAAILILRVARYYGQLHLKQNGLHGLHGLPLIKIDSTMNTNTNQPLDCNGLPSKSKKKDKKHGESKKKTHVMDPITYKMDPKTNEKVPLKSNEPNDVEVPQHDIKKSKKKARSKGKKKDCDPIANNVDSMITEKVSDHLYQPNDFEVSQDDIERYNPDLPEQNVHSMGQIDESDPIAYKVHQKTVNQVALHPSESNDFEVAQDDVKPYNRSKSKKKGRSKGKRKDCNPIVYKVDEKANQQVPVNPSESDDFEVSEADKERFNYDLSMKKFHSKGEKDDCVPYTYEVEPKKPKEHTANPYGPIDLKPINRDLSKKKSQPKGEKNDLDAPGYEMAPKNPEKDVPNDVDVSYEKRLQRDKAKKKVSQKKAKDEFDPFTYKLEPKKFKVMSDEKRFSREGFERRQQGEAFREVFDNHPNENIFDDEPLYNPHSPVIVDSNGNYKLNPRSYDHQLNVLPHVPHDQDSFNNRNPNGQIDANSNEAKPKTEGSDSLSQDRENMEPILGSPHKHKDKKTDDKKTKTDTTNITPLSLTSAGLAWIKNNPLPSVNPLRKDFKVGSLKKPIDGDENSGSSRKHRHKKLKKEKKDENDSFSYKMQPKKFEVMSDEQRLSRDIFVKKQSDDDYTLQQPSDTDSVDWDAILKSHQKSLLKLIKELDDISDGKPDEEPESPKPKAISTSQKMEKNKSKGRHHMRKSQPKKRAEKQDDYIQFTSKMQPKKLKMMSNEAQHTTSIDGQEKLKLTPDAIKTLKPEEKPKQTLLKLKSNANPKGTKYHGHGRIGRVASLTIDGAPRYQRSQFQSSSIVEVVRQPKRAMGGENSMQLGNKKLKMKFESKSNYKCNRSDGDQLKLSKLRSICEEDDEVAAQTLQPQRLQNLSHRQIQTHMMNLQLRMEGPCTSKEAQKLSLEMEEYRRKLKHLSELDLENMETTSSTSSDSNNSTTMELEISDHAYARLLYQSFIESMDYAPKPLDDECKEDKTMDSKQKSNRLCATSKKYERKFVRTEQVEQVWDPNLDHVLDESTSELKVEPKPKPKSKPKSLKRKREK